MRITRFLRRTAITCLMLLGLSAAMPVPASAGLAITPTTLIIQGRDRYADLTIINTDKRPHTYALEWRFFRMEQDTGAYTNLDTSTTEFDLAKHLIFTPKRIALAPSSAQKIRFALRLNGEAPPPGDYRAHFMVRELPQGNAAEQPGAEDLAQDPSKKRAVMGVNINFGFTMPVIYRVGESADTVTLEKITVARDPKNGKITLTVPVSKTQSTFGLYGKISVDLVEGGKERHIGGMSNANIFAEATRRVFELPLGVPALESGTLRVSMVDRDDPKKVYASKDIPIQ